MALLICELGGKCAYCCEEDNWTLLDAFINDDGTKELKLKCFTPRYGEEDGAFLYECGNVIDIVDGVRQ